VRSNTNDLTNGLEPFVCEPDGRPEYETAAVMIALCMYGAGLASRFQNVLSQLSSLPLAAKPGKCLMAHKGGAWQVLAFRPVTSAIGFIGNYSLGTAVGSRSHALWMRLIACTLHDHPTGVVVSVDRADPVRRYSGLGSLKNLFFDCLPGGTGMCRHNSINCLVARRIGVSGEKEFILD
jgi:hypothetical protein